MADTVSDKSDSESSSIEGGPIMMPPSPVTRQLRIESLQQANKVLKVELETFRLRVKSLQEENRALRQASVNIQARAEQEEEFISNTLLKKIQALKKEKETLAINYEQEEECLTNDLSRKLNQLRQEKVQLEQSLEHEQEALVNKLMRKIEKLEAETSTKQANLDQLRREKVDLENTLEQEQEALVNKLWKRMEKLEAEKRNLQEKLDQPVSAPSSPRDMISDGDTATNLTQHIQHLRSEVAKLKTQLQIAQQEHSDKMAQYALEEKHIREENLRLQRKLQMEMERREQLCRHLSESESSLEMDEERHFNESHGHGVRPRTVSSPIPYNPSPSSSRPLSPGQNFGGASGCPGSRDAFSPPSPLGKCPTCGQPVFHLPGNVPYISSTSPPPGATHHQFNKPRSTLEKFVKPAVPPVPVFIHGSGSPHILSAGVSNFNQGQASMAGFIHPNPNPGLAPQLSISMDKPST